MARQTPAKKLAFDESVPPEFRLVAAIISQAEQDARRRSGNPASVRREAAAWLKWLRYRDYYDKEECEI